ncbi:hypothetical protein LPJ77_004189, partial [Coemansia sp. RSA 2523]
MALAVRGSRGAWRWRCMALAVHGSTVSSPGSVWISWYMALAVHGSGGAWILRRMALAVRGSVNHF